MSWRMRFRMLWTLSLSVVFVIACQPAPSGEDVRNEMLEIFPLGEQQPARAELASAAFEQLKSLAGDWRGVAGDFPASATYEVIAEGTIVLERVTVEDPIEMVTVYRLDRGRLVAEHFCMAGNQPRLYLDELSTASSLHFTFAGATSLASPMDAHMRGGA